MGIYTSLASIFKLGHRSELLPQLPLLGALTHSPAALLEDTSVMRRKLGIKLLQRVAAVHLPPRVAAWRYQRGSRSLEKNLQLGGAKEGGAGAKEGEAAQEVAAAAAAEEEEEEEEEDAVPGEIEEILEQLLRGLRDADTVVRWSAAKGVGRVTARLPLDLADDIVEMAIDLLSPSEEANAWHGGCLALAELSRRGLLLPARLPQVRRGASPSRLALASRSPRARLAFTPSRSPLALPHPLAPRPSPQVTPRIVTALHYDRPRGASSVGTHVRDAACYVCWAFARAFEPAVMAPHVGSLAQVIPR